MDYRESAGWGLLEVTVVAVVAMATAVVCGEAGLRVLGLKQKVEVACRVVMYVDAHESHERLTRCHVDEEELI